jgi:separase
MTLATPQAQSDAVKTAISTNNATASTVTTLQSLLSAESKPTTSNKSANAPSTAPTRARKPTTTKTNTSRAPATKKEKSIDVHQDENRSLTAKERYALATEVVNITLKVLTETLKAKTKAQSKSTLSQTANATAPSTPRKLSRTSSSISQRALQPRSGNSPSLNATPSKSKCSPRETSQSGAADVVKQETHVAPTGECSRLAFSFLRSVNTKQLGMKDLPPFQLENGMLVLAGKLLALGLDSLAIKELRIVKSRLEATGKAKPSAPPGKETLAGLLQVTLDLEKHPAALPLVITYQNLVLRAISASSKPATIEACVEFLDPAEPMSPCNLIKLQGERSGDRNKAGRLLESLSSTILGLCPSLSSKADLIAEDRTVSPAPEAVLRLQTIGLQIREQWWELVQHQPDVEKELLDPLFKCLSAFIRRTRKRRAVQGTYDTANNCVRAVISTHGDVDSKALISIRRAMSSLAEGTGCSEEAQDWSAALDKQCGDLDANHAQRIAAIARRVSGLDSKAAATALRELIARLQDTASGSTSDYETLLADLSRLSAGLPEDAENVEDLQKLGTLSVAFALRFARSYPGRGLIPAQQIIHHTLRRSKPSDLAISWISHEAVQVLVDAGALKTVAQEATSCPLDIAFASSVDAVTLARALRLMVLRTLKSSLNEKPAIVFDDTRLSNLERGILLEYQLAVAVEHASRSKYLVTLQSMVPHILRTLHGLYSSSEHPLRRANVATQALRLREQFPAIVPSHAANVWVDTQVDQEALAQDEGLREYAEDIDVALRLTKILLAGHPSVRNLKPILLTWQRMLDNVSEKTEHTNKIFDVAGLQTSFNALAALFGALGEDAHLLSVLAMIDKVNALQEASARELLESAVESAQQWLSLGYSEKSGSLLASSEKHLTSSDVPVLSKLQWHLAYADYLLEIDNSDKAKSSLEAAACLRDTLPPIEVSKEQRAAYERAHGTGWLLHSRYSIATGAPHDALAAAKHAMKLINSTWCRLEKGQAEATSGSEEESLTSEAKEKEISELTTGVSKLQLLPKSSPKEEAETAIKGAAFWPLVPLLCRALMHLSDMYSHHGLFSEANYYSERATEIAGSVGSSVLLSRTRSHRAVLLSLADKVEEAELCLTGSEGCDLSSSPLAAVERLRAKGAVKVKDGALEEAAEVYEEAAQLVAAMQTDEFASKLSCFEDVKKVQKLATKPARPPPAAPKTARSSARTRQAAIELVPTKTTRPSARAAKVPVVEKSFCLLQKMRATILLDKTLLGLDASNGEEQVLQALAPLKPTVTDTLKQRQVQYRQLMAKATAALQMDFAYNILFDSTLSLPALLRPAANEDAAQSSPKKKAASARPNTRTGQRKTAPKAGFKDILNEARGCLLTGNPSTLQFGTTAEVYSGGASLLDVSTLSSSVDATGIDNRVNSLQTGLTLDLPRIVAKHREQSAALVDAHHDQKTAPFEWPSMSATTSDTSIPQLSASTFQEEYINPLPTPWTTISLSLDAANTSLYVARYRAHQPPFIVRLPFSRHQDEDLGNEAFDYAAGKEELADIIQLSNTSCHNNGNDLSAQGAKSAWWSEREALDRRLQELLINMEDMWFGGFKGVFSPRQNKPDLLARFRAAFEAALDRHLPSRQAAKGRAAKLALDHHVLELFVNLGSDNDGAIDLDEPISDLLYFVVDMLQFNGERNAYDEIDFDEMTVEILDALRTYHEAGESDDTNKDEHVVLVLDKRLQAFPWENLPCLEQCSVSRVGSMLSLRNCVNAMRASRQGVAGDRHMVSRKSGTFILNPSSDLASTQTALLPALSKVAAAEGADWSSFVNRAPSEEDFKTTLETSAMTLYFGHGAGSQYIRPRTIKKLEKCSEVVWLMGCSSGAVTEYGELEPQAVPLAYLSAGDKTSSLSGEDLPENSNSKCLSVVATLWDVTDKDIDRFSLAVGEDWGLWSPTAEPAKLPAKTPKKRDRLVVAPTTPQKAPKTPGKTPRVLKTPGGAKTPARNRSRSAVRDRSVKLSLAAAVARSRDACYLRYLNGAAPVVYGVPVYLGE